MHSYAIVHLNLMMRQMYVPSLHGKVSARIAAKLGSKSSFGAAKYSIDSFSDAQ